MAKIKKMKQNNENIYPVTHEDAVFDSDGVSIGTKIDNIEADMIDLLDIGEIEGVENNIVNRIENTEEKIKNFIIINVKDFGAKGDGITDDSDAILEAISNLPKENAILYFPPGLYIHGDGVETGYSYEADPDYPNHPLIDQDNINIGKDIRLYFEGFKNLKISGYGAEIRSNDLNGECKNNCIMKITQCENIIIEGLTLNGRRDERGCKFTDYSVWDSGERHNLSIHSSKHVKLKNISSFNSMMDGIAIYGDPNYGHSEHVYVENCICNYNYRIGLLFSCVKDVNVTSGVFNDNGHNGTLPKAGIDIEADWDSLTNERVYIHEIECCNNDSCGLIFANNLNDCEVKNSYFEANDLSSTSNISNVVVRNCIFSNSALSGNYNINYFDNIIEFDHKMIPDNNTVTPHYKMLDYTNSTVNGNTTKTFVVRNKFICYLDELPTDFEGVLGGIRVPEKEGTNIIFSDNVVINALACAITYPITLNGCSEIRNNSFIYNFENNFDNNFLDITGLQYNFDNNNRVSTNNTIIGYGNNQFINNMNSCTRYNGRLETTYRLVGQSGQLFKFNTQKMYIKTTVFNYKCDEASCIFNQVTLSSNTNYNDNIFVKFYKDNEGYLYLKIDDNASYYMTIDIHVREIYDKTIQENQPILIKSDVDINTLTLL